MRISKLASVSSKAADSRIRIAAVGLASARSTLLIIAFDTPDRVARSPCDQPRASRSVRTVWASRADVSSTIVTTNVL